MTRTSHFLLLLLSAIGPSVASLAQNYPDHSTPVASYQRTPQIASAMCWAATTQMVINTFYPSRVNQYQLAEDARIKYTYQGCSACSTSGTLTDCCNRRGYPGFFEKYGVLTDDLPSPVALEWQQLQGELVGGHPFIFGWNFAQGLHFLIAERYWTTIDQNGAEKRLVDIWDPLPVGNDGGNAYTISYDAYAVNTKTTLPFNDMGESVEHWGDYVHFRLSSSPGSPLDVDVTGQPSGDAPSPASADSTSGGIAASNVIWQSRRPAAARAVANNASCSAVTGNTFSATSGVPNFQGIGQPNPAVASLAGASDASGSVSVSGNSNSVPASQAISETRQLAPAALATADIPTNYAGSGYPKGTPGYPFPVVALSLTELREADASAAEPLLKKNINTVLFPVQSSGRVTDNFLMIRSGDTWRQGGYANLTVTRSLVALREARPMGDLERSKYYLLSVPALGGFFLGYRTDRNARFISTADFSSTIRKGRTYSARQLLTALIAAAKRDETPGPAVTPAPPTP